MASALPVASGAMIPTSQGNMSALDFANYVLSIMAPSSGDVTGPAGSVYQNLAMFDTTTGKVIADSGYSASTLLAGAGDVSGPASSVDENIALFDGVTGKAIQDGGLPLARVQPRIVVTQASHLGTPSAGVYTLTDGAIYLIAGYIDLGSARIDQNGAELEGLNNSVSIITSTTTGALITTSKIWRMNDLTLGCPNGALFDFTGGAYVSLNLRSIISTSCVTVGTFHNTGSGIIELSAFLPDTTGITFTGSGSGDFGMLNSRILGQTGIALDLGAAVFNIISLNTVVFSSAPGSTAISGSASSANITTRATIKNCNFNGSGAAIAVITQEDLKYTFKDNPGLADTRADCGMSVGGNSTATTISATSTPVKVNTGGGAASYIDNRFSVNANGTITYIGLEDINVHITYNVYADVDAGSNRVCSYYVAINGTVAIESKGSNSFDANNPKVVTVQLIAALSTSDEIDLYVENTTTIDDITSIDITGVIT